MGTFIKMNEDTRLLKSTIKKIKRFGNTKINIYFSTSRYKVEMETFDFVTKEKRDEMMDYLDAIVL